MTATVNISWSELLQNPIVTAQHGNDGNRIAIATESLKQTAHQFVEVLNERARLLANSAQFDKALLDAAAIRAILPGSGIGYLCAGDVHCHQGHHSAALSIYDQGLAEVPESDPYYQQLQQHRMKAIDSNNKRVDFITRLPLDIVITNILPRVYPRFSRSVQEFLYVSRTWQERILKRTRGLRFYFGYGANTLKTGHDQLIRFAPYIETLSGSLSNAGLDDLFSRANFSNLKELSIHCYPTTPLLPLIHGLQMIADSLTHLTLFECPGFQLRDIVEACPNLVYLQTMNVDAVMPLSSSSAYPKMTHLALYGQSDRALMHENMVDVIRRFPSLRVLEISPSPDTRLLPLLHEHCPYLQTICCGVLNCVSRGPTEKAHLNRKGITTAYLEGHGFSMQDDLIQFLYRQRDSLETFDFSGDIQINDDPVWTISNGRLQSSDHHQQQHNSPLFPQLDDLSFTNANPSTTCVPMILWILLNASNLTTIRIHDVHFRPEIANAMSQLMHLEEVQIDIVSTEDDAGIHQFLEHHIALGDRSTLERVILEMHHVEIFQKPWIPLLSRLTRLKDLNLLAAVISDNCIPVLAEIGQGCPALEGLNLGLIGADLADGLLMPLRKLPNLKWLRIGAIEPLSSNDLMALCTFRCLEKLKLQFIVADDLLEMLEDHIPNVDIDP